MAVFPTDVNTVMTQGAPQQLAPTATLISDLFKQIDTSVNADAEAKSQAIAATGDTEEGNLYTSAQGIAQQNARLALVGGQIAQSQEQLQVARTIGSQRATVAGSGFAAAGSAVNIMRASTQQGVLQNQLLGVNANLQAGGYQEQASAASAEAAAANTAGAEATSLATTSGVIAAASKTNAVNTAAAMGLTVPGLSNLSSTSIPTVDVADVMQQTAQQNTGITDPLANAEAMANGQPTTTGPFATLGSTLSPPVTAQSIAAAPMQPLPVIAPPAPPMPLPAPGI